MIPITTSSSMRVKATAQKRRQGPKGWQDAEPLLLPIAKVPFKHPARKSEAFLSACRSQTLRVAPIDSAILMHTIQDLHLRSRTPSGRSEPNVEAMAADVNDRRRPENARAA